ncbi:unnamed protein product [Owenia fusiformis]|uniref:Fibroblast growth factor n=1 Tax=Owenia fusiformis TaxID=6347 RepID=A0A8S4N6T1_OWEFU|nr:unnamed protein product [Owenia fusiformis]
MNAHWILIQIIWMIQLSSQIMCKSTKNFNIPVLKQAAMTKDALASSTGTFTLRLRRNNVYGPKWGPGTPKRRLKRNLPRLSDTKYFMSSTGYNLVILPNGRITGHSRPSRYALLERIHVSSGIIRLRGVTTGRYISINHRGRLRSTTEATEETLFLERIESNFYSTYKSYKYSAMDWCLGIRHSDVTLGQGRAEKVGCRTGMGGRKAAFFLPISP